MLETRTATAADAALITSHRRAMFASMGGFDESVLEALGRASEPWTRRMIEAGKYLGWIFSEDQVPIASAGMLLLDWPPHPFDPRAKPARICSTSSSLPHTAVAGWRAPSLRCAWPKLGAAASASFRYTPPARARLSTNASASKPPTK
jgi:hypothetical protein